MHLKLHLGLVFSCTGESVTNELTDLFYLFLVSGKPHFCANCGQYPLGSAVKGCIQLQCYIWSNFKGYVLVSVPFFLFFFFYLFWFTQYKIIKQPNEEGTREVPLAEDCSAVAPVSGRGVNIEPSVNQAPAIISNTLEQNSINLLFGFFNIHKNIFLEAAGIAVRGRTANIHILSLWLEYLHQILYYEGWRTRKAHSASYVMAQSLSGRANNGTIIQADIFFVSNIFCFFVSVCA